MVFLAWLYRPHGVYAQGERAAPVGDRRYPVVHRWYTRLCCYLSVITLHRFPCAHYFGPVHHRSILFPAVPIPGTCTFTCRFREIHFGEHAPTLLFRISSALSVVKPFDLAETKGETARQANVDLLKGLTQATNTERQVGTRQQLNLSVC